MTPARGRSVPGPVSEGASDAAIGRWLRRRLSVAPPRAKSLVVTVWGDSIAPRGGALWMSELIVLLEQFGINERLVRTSVYRLAQEGWLAVRQEGRRSRYRLTPLGRRRFEHAYRRIYAPPVSYPWNGDWHLVIVPPARIDESARRELRKDLEWDGFGALTPALFARPARPGDERSLRETTRAAGVAAHVAIVTARGHAKGAGSIASLAGDCWNLKAVASAATARFCGALSLHGASARHVVLSYRRGNALCFGRCSFTISGALRCTIRNCPPSCCPRAGRNPRHTHCAATSIAACTRVPNRISPA